MISTIGIVCGMAAEARALGAFADDPRIAIAVTGSRPERAESEARRLSTQGVRALVSWGIAGALDPSLKPGVLIVPDRVEDGAGRSSVFDARLVAAVRRERGQAARPHGLLAGTDAILFEPGAKAALAASGAIAADMESHRVAAVAGEAGIPALAIRAISDPAWRALPRLAATAIDAGGRPRIGAVLIGLARRPADLPRLLAAGRDSRAALAALGAAASGAIAALLRALGEPPVR